MIRWFAERYLVSKRRLAPANEERARAMSENSAPQVSAIAIAARELRMLCSPGMASSISPRGTPSFLTVNAEEPLRSRMPEAV